MQSNHAMVICKTLLLTLIWYFANLLSEINPVSANPNGAKQIVNKSFFNSPTVTLYITFHLVFNT